MADDEIDVVRLRQRTPVDLLGREILQVLFETRPDPLIHLD